MAEMRGGGAQGTWQGWGGACNGGPSEEVWSDPHPSLSPSAPLAEMQGPGCSTLSWHEDGALRAGCTQQVPHAALGTKDGQRVGSALPLQPPFWSLVFLFAPRGLSTQQRKGLWNEGSSSCPGEPGPWCLRGSAKISKFKPRLTPLPSLLEGTGQAPRTGEGAG